MAEHGGFEIVATRERAWFFDRRTRNPTLAAAVSGGIAAITLINALLLALSWLTGGELADSWQPAAIVFAIALLSIGVCSFSLKLRRARVERPRSELRPLAVVDRATGTLLDGEGRTIAPVAQVRGARGLLVGSSAPAVFIQPPEGARIEVFRGTLVGGGIDRALDALVELGFAR
jgi:hypothetical protein